MKIGKTFNNKIEDLKRRPPGRPLTLNELLMLKTIPFSELKEDDFLLDLLIEFSSDSIALLNFLINILSQILS